MSQTNVNVSRKVLVDVVNVKKSYGKKEILHGISFKIYEGEHLAIIGPNGAGKSTISEIIAGIKTPTSGELHYSFGNNKSDISKNIGIQFQESTYPMFVKVNSIVRFFINAAKMKITTTELEKLLELFNLKEIYNQYATGLSGGQKQRLNILLAIIHNPKLIILDEVGTGLDVETRTNVKKFIKDYLLRTNSTSIIISHNTDEIMSLSNRIIVIYDGRLFQDRKLNDILAEYENFDAYIDDLFLVKFKKEKDRKKLLLADSKLSKNA